MIKCMASHMGCTIYGYTYRFYNVWRLTLRLQYMHTHVGGTKYGASYSGYNVWRII